MRVFVRTKAGERWRSAVRTKLDELEKRLYGHDRDINKLFDALRDVMDPPEGPRRKIGFRTD